MKNVILNLIFGVACLIFGAATSAHAQSVRGSLDVKASNGAEANKTRHFYQGEERTYAITFTPAQTDSVTEAKLIVNDTPVSCVVKEGKITSTLDQKLPCSTAVTDGTDTFVLKYSYSARKNEDGTPIIEEASTELQNCLYVVYTKPENKVTVSIVGYKNGIDSTEKTINAEGIESSLETGNPDGWSYYWEIDGAEQKDAQNSATMEHTFTYSGSSDYRDYEIRLCMVNSIVPGKEGDILKSAPATIRVYKPLKAEILNNPRNMVVGHTKTFTMQLTGGQKDKWSGVTCKVNDVTCDAVAAGNDKYTFKYTPTAADNAGTLEVTVTAINTPVDSNPGTTNPATASVKVWSEPTVTCYFENDPTFEDKGGIKDHVLAVSGNGGCPNDSENGWYYVWKQDDNPVQNDNGEESSYTIPGDPTTTINSIYSVTAQHIVDGEIVVTETFSQHVMIWAKPTTPEYEAVAFDGEYPEITFTPTTGYLGQDGGWRYTVKKGEKILIENINTDTFGIDEVLYVSEGVEIDENTDFTVIAQNYYKDGEYWDKFTIHLTIQVFAQPTVAIRYGDKTFPANSNKVLTGTIDSYYNNDIEFVIVKTLGIDGQWNCFNINYEGEKNIGVYGADNSLYIGQTSKKMYASDVINRGEQVERGKLTGYVSNGRGVNQKKWTVDIDVNVWPQVKWGKDIILAQNGVREGDTYTVEAPAPLSGGYQPDGTPTAVCYTYKAGDIITAINTPENSYTYKADEISTMPAGSGKQANTRSLDIVVKAIGPNGKEWDSKTYTKEIGVYRRPQMPESLVMKGNGTSHTYIMTIPNSESRYESDYNYVLTDGNTVYYSGPLRYAVADNAMGLMAACYWTYSQNVTIYSDFLVYGSQSVKPCHWSTFNGEGPKQRGAVDESAASIEAPTVDTLPEATICDMQGRRVVEPQRGKLYIANGKKMIFK